MLRQNNSCLLIKLILIILLQTFSCGGAEFYSSVHEMSRLVEFENTFLKHMQKFITLNEDKLDFLKARLGEFVHERDEALSEGPTYFDSPVNQYLLTKRLTVDWERVENLMSHKTGEKTIKLFENFRNKTSFSYQDEFNGGITGLLRLQEAYRLKTADIANGILQDIQYPMEINARLCYDIGVYAMEINKLKLAHSWLMEALKRLSNNHRELDLDVHLETSDILLALANAKTKLGDIQGANSTYTESIELYPESQDIARAFMIFSLENYDKKSVDIDYSSEHEAIPEDMLSTPQHERYKLTCSGLIKRTPAEDRDLRCGYLTETHPFLTLAPIKVEELNHDPLLVQYYDVLSDSEIEIMKKIANHRVQRATVMGLNQSIVSPVRTSQFLFVPKTEHKLLQTIDQRVEDMTNLNMKYSEDHQFQNYGIGGHYGEHHDYFHDAAMKTEGRISNLELGNRIATVLFYLSDVEQGGGTAFPYLKRLLMPKKGAAAFWHNLHASGVPDVRTLHGGCPIIVGSKWVLNRWIRERNQDKGRPCDLYNDVVYGRF